MLFVTDVNPEWWLVPTTAAACLANVRASTIRVWHHRGHLTRHGSPDIALWDMREILARTRRDSESLDNHQTVTHDDVQ